MQQQPPPPPPVVMGDYSQPPPPLPSNLDLLNNGDFDTLKKSLMLLAGSSDPNTPVSGSPGMGATGVQLGYGADVASVSRGSSRVLPGYGGNVADVSKAMPGREEKYGGYSGESGSGDTSGNGEGDAMDLDLPTAADNKDVSSLPWLHCFLPWTYLVLGLLSSLLSVCSNVGFLYFGMK